MLRYKNDRWRFLFSSETQGKSMKEMADRISYRGPTVLLVTDGSGKMFGAFASTSWAMFGWVGDGEFMLRCEI